MRLKILLIPFLCGICLASISAKIDAVLANPSQKNVVYGVKVVRCENGEEVYSHNSDLSLIPASNMKIFTSAAALAVLGKDFEFKTGVYLDNSNVIIKGSGDPLLGDNAALKQNDNKFGWEFDKIVQALKDKQVKTVKDIIVDSSVFDDMLVHPSWPANELNRHYSAEVSGINYNGNCIDVTVYPSSGGVSFTKKPDTNYVNITSRASANRNAKNTVWISRLLASNKMTIHGNCGRKAAPISVAIHRPAVYFGYILAERLNKNGIKLTGSIVEKFTEINDGASKLTEFSTPLEQVLVRCNRDSFNLAAEALAKRISAEKTKGCIGGSWRHCGEIIKNMLKQEGVKTDGFVFADGSGLSRSNKAAADMITTLLLKIHNSEEKDIFVDTLAVGGVRGSGPVRRYFKDKPYKGAIFAKSGTINGVKALSGYCDTQKGVYAFSIITNSANWKTRGAINDIVKAVFDD